MSQTLSANGNRQHYLDAIGIRVWLPTQSLVGAAPSPEWVWGDLPNDDVVQTAVRSKTNEAVAVNEPEGLQPPQLKILNEETGVQSLVAKKLVETDLPVADVPATSAKSSETSVAGSSTTQRAYNAPPRFRLAMVVYSDALVISQLPMDVLQPLVPEHQTLLHRILQSIGLGAGSATTQLFAWPIVNNPNVDQSVTLAQAAVKSLEKRLDASTLPLFVFGHQLVGYLGLPEDATLDGTHIDERPVIAGPTLNELISVPGFKRDLWVRLQSFQSAL